MPTPLPPPRRAIATPAAVFVGLVPLLVCQCIGLSAARTRSEVVVGDRQPLAESTLLDSDGPRRKIYLDVNGLLAKVAVVDETLCVQRTGTKISRSLQQTTDYGPLAYAATAVQAAIGLAAATLAVTQTDGENPAQRIGLAALAGWWLVDAAASAAIIWRGWPRHAAVELPSELEMKTPQLVVCATDLPAGVTIAAHSSRNLIAATTDELGRVQWDVGSWPAHQFPYTSPIATVHCPGCQPVDVFLDATPAAQLVVARQDLDDLSNWLRNHRGAPDTARVTQAHQRLLRRVRDQQEDGLRRARKALEEGDLVQAATHARQCTQLARLPAPACERLLQQIDDQFVQVQLTLAKAAIAKEQWQLARDAHYRCRLVDRDRPSCLELGKRIDSWQQQSIAAEFTRAVVRKDLATAQQALLAYLQISTNEGVTEEMQARLGQLRQQLAQDRVEQLVRRAGQWIRKRKWARALVVLEACLATADAKTAACAALWTKLPPALTKSRLSPDR